MVIISILFVVLEVLGVLAFEALILCLPPQVDQIGVKKGRPGVGRDRIEVPFEALPCVGHKVGERLLLVRRETNVNHVPDER